jgi:leader peptidase (prepilin peptidase)/N-methyltransferase
VSWSLLPLLVAGWGGLGIVVGLVIRRGSTWLAKLEGLCPGNRPWQVIGPVVMNAALFTLCAWRFGLQPTLLIKSLWVAVLVHVFFFDAEHRLILDRVMVPAAVAALALSVVTPGLGVTAALVGGIGAGVAFFLLALLGSWAFRTQAMGFGDVKLAALLGLLLGNGTVVAISIGMILGGAVAVTLLLLRLRTLHDAIPYGPFLVTGALVALLVG